MSKKFKKALAFIATAAMAFSATSVLPYSTSGSIVASAADHEYEAEMPHDKDHHWEIDETTGEKTKVTAHTFGEMDEETKTATCETCKHVATTLEVAQFNFDRAYEAYHEQFNEYEKLLNDIDATENNISNLKSAENINVALEAAKKIEAANKKLYEDAEDALKAGNEKPAQANADSIAAAEASYNAAVLLFNTYCSSQTDNDIKDLKYDTENNANNSTLESTVEEKKDTDKTLYAYYNDIVSKKEAYEALVNATTEGYIQSLENARDKAQKSYTASQATVKTFEDMLNDTDVNLKESDSYKDAIAAEEENLAELKEALGKEADGTNPATGLNAELDKLEAALDAAEAALNSAKATQIAADDAIVKGMSLTIDKSNLNIAVNIYVTKGSGVKVKGAVTSEGEISIGGVATNCDILTVYVSPMNFNTDILVTKNNGADLSQYSVSKYIEVASTYFTGVQKNLVEAMNDYCKAAQAYLSSVKSTQKYTAYAGNVSDYNYKGSGVILTEEGGLEVRNYYDVDGTTKYQKVSYTFGNGTLATTAFFAGGKTVKDYIEALQNTDAKEVANTLVAYDAAVKEYVSSSSNE